MFKIPDEFRDIPEAVNLREAEARFGIETPVERDSVDHHFERSEASGASISPAARGRGDARCARASFVGSQGSTECRPTIQTQNAECGVSPHRIY